jgi:micrococcal nuclease
MLCYRWKNLLLILVLLFCSVLSAAAGEVRGRVSWVYDGDTVKVEGVGKVRLIGIDTPEKKASERDKTFRRAGVSPRQLRAGAKRATDYLIRNGKGKIVTLTFDRDKTDHYGRILAYLTLPDGRMLNRELLREGLACVYRRFDFRWREDFIQMEAAAQSAGRGLWAQK